MARIWTEENASLETFNAWIHGIGFALSIPAGFALAQLAIYYHPSMVVACIVYGLSLSAMYLFSTLSHAVRDPSGRHRMRSLDQGVIYTLIAGTVTPFIWSSMLGWPRILMITLVWLAAAAGFYSKVLAKHRVDNMTTVSYIVMGWLPAVALFWSTSTICFLTMLLGGLIYTLGVLFLQNDHRAWYFHPVWHVMVILASASHYIGIAMFAILRLDR
jgi:hemolysin III